MTKRRKSNNLQRWEHEHLSEARRIFRAMVWTTSALIAAVFVLFVFLESRPSTYQQQIAEHPEWASPSKTAPM